MITPASSNAYQAPYIINTRPKRLHWKNIQT